MSIEFAEKDRRRRRESLETNYEAREATPDPELTAAASLERADYLVKEVKNSKRQMQNIILHMRQVVEAIAQIRAELQLQAKNESSSLIQDQARVTKLKQQIALWEEELVNMREDLIRAQISELKNGIGVGLSAAALQQKATEMVNNLLSQISN